MTLKSVLPALFLLTACGKTETTEITTGYVMPPELKQCHIYKMFSKTQKDLWVTARPKVIGTQWDETESCGKNCTEDVPHSVITDRN